MLRLTRSIVFLPDEDDILEALMTGIIEAGVFVIGVGVRTVSRSWVSLLKTN